MSLDTEVIQRRLNETTPGEWRWPVEHRDIFTVVVMLDNVALDFRCPRPADCEFVSHAKNDIADLLAEVQRLSAEVQRLNFLVSVRT